MCLHIPWQTIHRFSRSKWFMFTNIHALTPYTAVWHIHIVIQYNTADMTMTYDTTYAQLTKWEEYLPGIPYHRYRVVCFKQPRGEANIHVNMSARLFTFNPQLQNKQLLLSSSSSSSSSLMGSIPYSAWGYLQVITPGCHGGNLFSIKYIWYSYNSYLIKPFILSFVQISTIRGLLIKLNIFV